MPPLCGTVQRCHVVASKLTWDPESSGLPEAALRCVTAWFLFRQLCHCRQIALCHLRRPLHHPLMHSLPSVMRRLAYFVHWHPHAMWRNMII